MNNSCEFCREESPDYMTSTYGSVQIDKLGKVVGLKVKTDYCPPHHKCTLSAYKPTIFYPINFCPWCGRKLSDNKSAYDKGFVDGYKQGYEEGCKDGEQWANDNPPIRSNY